MRAFGARQTQMHISVQWFWLPAPTVNIFTGIYNILLLLLLVLALTCTLGLFIYVCCLCFDEQASSHSVLIVSDPYVLQRRPDSVLLCPTAKCTTWCHFDLVLSLSALLFDFRISDSRVGQKQTLSVWRHVSTHLLISSLNHPAHCAALSQAVTVCDSEGAETCSNVLFYSFVPLFRQIGVMVVKCWCVLNLLLHLKQ